MDNAKFDDSGIGKLIVSKEYYERNFKEIDATAANKLMRLLEDDTTLLLQYLYLCTFAEDGILRYGMMIKGHRQKNLTTTNMYNVMGLSWGEISNLVDKLKEFCLLFFDGKCMKVTSVAMVFIGQYKEMIQELYCMTDSKLHRQIGTFLYRIWNGSYRVIDCGDTVEITLDNH